MDVQYLLTGADSQLGRYIIADILKQGDKVRALVSEEAVKEITALGAECFVGEIFDKDSMKDFFKLEDPRHSVFIHADELVSISEQKNLQMRRINVSGTMNVVDLCIKNKIGKFVYLGSAYSLPDTKAGEMSAMDANFDRHKVQGDYAESKAEAANYVKEKVLMNKFNAVFILPTFMIGPGFKMDSDIGKVISGVVDKQVAPIKGGHSFVDVRDVADAIIAAAESGERGNGYIISGNYMSSLEFIQNVCDASGITMKLKPVSNAVMNGKLGSFYDLIMKLKKKDNPKEVYALFKNSPNAHYDSSDAVLPKEIHKTDIKDSIKEVVDAYAGMGGEKSAPAEAVEISATPEEPAEPKTALEETDAKIDSILGQGSVLGSMMEEKPAEAAEPVFENIPEDIPENIPEIVPEDIPAEVPNDIINGVVDEMPAEAAFAEEPESPADEEQI